MCLESSAQRSRRSAEMRPLPTEVLQGILQAVQTQSRIDANYNLPLCLRVCPEWRDTGLRLIYTDLVLSNYTLAKFIQSNNVASLALIRSLSLRLNPLGPYGAERPHSQEQQKLLNITGSASTQMVWHNTRSLVALIPCMRRLETFSFMVVRQELADPVDGFSLHHNDIANLISAFPTSLRNLEIDTLGYDIESEASKHLCSLIQLLLPQLSHLRLRLARICPKLLSPLTEGVQQKEDGDGSRLKTLVISFINVRGASTTSLCGTPLSYHRHGSMGSNLNDIESCRLLRQTFLPAARANSVAGAFPGIVRFSVFDNSSRRPPQTPIEQFPAINERDILKNKTISFPFRPLASGNQRVEELRIRGTNGEEIEILGHMRDVEQIAEGPAWIETVDGSRFPAAFKMSRESREGGNIWKAPAVVSGGRSYGKVGLVWKLWDLEASEGRKLLHARESDGLGEVGWVEREPTARERARMQQ